MQTKKRPGRPRLYETKRKIYSFNLDPEVYKYIKEMAKKDGRSVSDFLNRHLALELRAIKEMEQSRKPMRPVKSMAELKKRAKNW